MKKLFLTISLGLILISNSSHAKEYVCDVEKKRIIEDLKQDVQCFHDSECAYFDYGYPWQPSLCFKAIVNKEKKNKNITNLTLIEEYNRNCIYSDEEERKKYIEFNNNLQTVECKEPPRTYCYKGFCRIQSYSIYNDK